MDKIKLGIIGIGNMGSSHAGNIKSGKCPEIELVAIADINPERLDWAKEQNYAENIAYFTKGIGSAHIINQQFQDLFATFGGCGSTISLIIAMEGSISPLSYF